MKKEELKDNKLKPIWFFKEGGALGEFEAPYAQFTSKLYLLIIGKIVSRINS